ncbi:MAG: rod shape-determining protein MreD [Armatimonadetes bacterium]|nr:rod shape-determining protein MreD [Armatimonadota bacterium]
MRAAVLGVFMLAVFIQNTVLDSLQLFGIKPDLVFVLVIFSALLRGQKEGAFTGFVAGFLMDLAAGSYLGLNALALLAAGYLAGIMQTALYKDNPFVVALVTLLVSFLTGLIYYLLFLYLGIFISPEMALGRITLFGAVYNALVALLLYRWFFRTYPRVYQ